MKASDFIDAGIQIDDTPTAALYAESALDWIVNKTTLEIDKSDLSTLTAGAKLFILKFGEIMSANATVTSESIAGLSQSFSIEARNNLLYDLALDLLNGYLKPQIKFTVAEKRWK